MFQIEANPRACCLCNPFAGFCKSSSAAIASNNRPQVTLNRIQSLKLLEGKPLEKPAVVKLRSERDPEKLFQLFKANSHNRLVIENRFAFEDTVSRSAGARRFDYIEHLLEHQKTLPQGGREGFIVRIIMLYAKAGMTKHAIDTFYDMHLYGCKRTIKSFNAALKVLSQTRNLESIEAFLAEVPEKFDLQLDIFSVNIVLKAFCEMGIVDKAYLIMINAEKLGIKPDVVTCTTLISALYTSKQFEIGNGLWNLMVRKGCLPNLLTFNVRIQYWVNSRRACMKKKWYPNVDTIHALLEGLKKNKQLGKAKMIVALARQRVPPFPSNQLSSSLLFLQIS
ncbi:hypothetical protein Ddye_006911 [Dipteronia dyeriana]|uniref:Pentatricopeptide repeat-containing protein n=1 Tax=Dipteronia dyeriana TaxID=168575 RepID=A0AAD9XJB0_9ROSI|nr:hypothetical protein Ddye_006911 [Dipteronia dyeriana]